MGLGLDYSERAPWDYELTAKRFMIFSHFLSIFKAVLVLFIVYHYFTKTR